jgi:hypothetical protein
MKFLIGGIIAAALLIAILVTIDVTSSPTKPPPGRCALQHYLILPDRCLSSCSSGVDCPTVTTRPYAVFWTQAASCADGIICGVRRERESKAFAARRLSAESSKLRKAS